MTVADASPNSANSDPGTKLPAKGATEISDVQLPEEVSVEKPSDTVVGVETDPNVVDFDVDDPENPLNWAPWRKWSIVFLVATTFMLATFGTIIIIPGVPQILDDFNVQDQKYSTLLVTIWELGEGIGSFLVGPISERFGRLPVYHAGNILFLICSVCTALSQNISMLVAFRFLNGLTITGLTLGPSIIGDLFVKENRGGAMALAIALPTIAPFTGPAIGSYTAERLGWRWAIWIIAIAVGTSTIVSLIFFRETYKVTILQRKVARLRKSTGNHLLRSRYEEHESQPILQSMIRPIQLLFRSSTIFLVTLYMAMGYGIGYVVLTTLVPMVEQRYHFSEGASGLAFLGRASGSVIGMLIYGVTSDRFLKWRKSKGSDQPENRLFHLVVVSVLLPVGLLFYGWTAEEKVHWIAPILGTAIIGVSGIVTMLSAENYLVDIFDIHAASAVAAGVILRSFIGTVFPIAGPPLYADLGYGWGNSVLALIVGLFVPALVLQMVFGARLRRKKSFPAGDSVEA